MSKELSDAEEDEKMRFIKRHGDRIDRGTVGYFRDAGSYKDLNAALDAIEESEKNMPANYVLDASTTLEQAIELGINVEHVNNVSTLEEQKDIITEIKKEIKEYKKNNEAEFTVI
ncbi:MAG: hypothetical protein FWC00_05860 [Firmicutes bacterium]|nr:hypothetical protein [Bacillota bacterium]